MCWSPFVMQYGKLILSRKYFQTLFLFYVEEMLRFVKKYQAHISLLWAYQIPLLLKSLSPLQLASIYAPLLGIWRKIKKDR